MSFARNVGLYCKMDKLCGYDLEKYQLGKVEIVLRKGLALFHCLCDIKLWFPFILKSYGSLTTLFRQKSTNRWESLLNDSSGNTFHPNKSLCNNQLSVTICQKYTLHSPSLYLLLLSILWVLIVFPNPHPSNCDDLSVESVSTLLTSSSHHPERSAPELNQSLWPLEFPAES